MSWDLFNEGVSKGFDEFLEVFTGNKELLEAMEDIKDHFDEKEK
ncbi:hypothetical protein [Mesobacillus jeotgali]|uniref:Uncharacterized protein n=1 Tax=Mesobacillus jeotgali TaxID=129985 RepID=A0ABY9VBQ7_9BACI|nr:hypothetical protein [Mesobacillus jeotgali]WNF21334.1 hypothetical protein RH061_14130 [Mesobacillus jeotgali]